MPSSRHAPVIGFAALALSIGGSPAYAEKLIFSPTTTALTVGHAAHSSLPKYTKCWENEGLDIDVVGIQGATAGMQQIAAKNITFANVGPEVLMMARAKGAKVKAVYTYSRSTIYRAVALKGAGIAKTTIFGLTNPEKAIKVHWQYYPATKPEGDEADALKKARIVFESRFDGYSVPAGVKWGENLESQWRGVAKLMQAENLLPADYDVTASYTNELIDEINKFDAKAVAEAAKADK